MPDSIEASEAMVANWTKQIQERAERYQAMAERVSEQSITERSRDGAVELTIDAKGLLTNLVIAETASTRRMSEVSAEIMRTLQRAQARIPELLQAVMAETIGLQDETANRLFEEAQGHFPPMPADDEPAAPRDLRFEVEEDESAPPSPTQPAPPRPRPDRRRRPLDDDEDDDMGGSIYNKP
jgi:DNA-binding protein YbaB